MSQDTITAYIRSMQAQVDEATRQTLYSAVVSAGGLTIRQGGAFIITNATGTYNVLETKTRHFGDGTQYQPVVINRPPIGEPAFAIFPTGTSATQPFFWAMFDRAGHFVLTDDAASGVGLSKPYLGVQLYNVIGVNAAWSGGGLMQIPGTTAAGTGVWQGVIPYVSHPYLQVDMYFGPNVGGSQSATMTVEAGGQVSTLTVTGGQNVSAPLLDLRGLIGSSSVRVDLKFQSTTASGSPMWFQALGCYQRGT